MEPGGAKRGDTAAGKPRFVTVAQANEASRRDTGNRNGTARGEAIQTEWHAVKGHSEGDKKGRAKAETKRRQRTVVIRKTKKTGSNAYQGSGVK
jgi:hypothetical protein